MIIAAASIGAAFIGKDSAVNATPDAPTHYEVQFDGSTLDGDLSWSDATPVVSGEFQGKLAENCTTVKAVFQAFGADGRVVTGGESGCPSSWPRFGPVSLTATSTMVKVSVAVEAHGKLLGRVVCPRGDRCHAE
jgi:hypothetical protein